MNQERLVAEETPPFTPAFSPDAVESDQPSAPEAAPPTPKEQLAQELAAALAAIGVSERNRGLVLARLNPAAESLTPYSEVGERFGLIGEWVLQVIRATMKRLSEACGPDDPLVVQARAVLYPPRSSRKKLAKIAYSSSPYETPIDAEALLNDSKALLAADEEVALAKLIEAGLYAEQKLKQPEAFDPITIGDLQTIATQGRRALQRFLEANRGLVWETINRHSRTIERWGIEDKDSLIAEVTELGLLRAVQLFDFTQGFKFSTYARARLDQALDKAIAEHLPGIARHDFVTAKRVIAYDRAQYSRTGCLPSAEETAKATKTTPQKVAKLRDYHSHLKRGSTRLDSAMSPDDWLSPHERVSRPEDRSPSSIVFAGLRQEIIRRAIGKLSPEQQEIIVRRYQESQPLEVIRCGLGLSPYKFKQLHRGALESLKKYLQDPVHADFIEGDE